LFVAAALFVIIGAGVAAAAAGLSMALGAFIAGLLLSETEFRKAIETTIGPFKGLLLGLFFFTVGMNIDIRELAREPLLLFASVVGLIVIKSVLLIGLGRIFRLSWPAAIETGLLLGPGGEFAFVGVGLATSLGLIAADVVELTLTVTSITMALIPALSLAARRLAPRFREHRVLEPGAHRGAGCRYRTCHRDRPWPGWTGGLQPAGSARLSLLAVDNDAAAVPEQRRQGREVYYGDATLPEFLRICGVMGAPGR
jgi:CPA2 family monovalent cation:H+ antiporter-2